MAALSGITVKAYRQSGIDWNEAGSATTNSTGDYDIGGMEAGTYRVYFQDSSGQYLPKYYNQKDDLVSANNIVVGDAEIVTGIDGTLSEAAHI